MTSFIRHRVRSRRLSDGSNLVVSETGDYAFLDDRDLEKLSNDPDGLSLSRQAELLSKFVIGRENTPGMRRLMKSRVAARQGTITGGPKLHIIVPTLWCEHSCQYCQVSRATNSNGHSMSEQDIDLVAESILEAPGNDLTVEYQGGDPLLRFDLVERSMAKIAAGAVDAKKSIRFVVASTLHQLTPEMCGVLKQYGAVLSTSIDGPARLHNGNRPIRGRDSYQRTIAGIEMARAHMGHDVVAALMTTTRASLSTPEDIVDEYVSIGMSEISLRPQSPFGFAALPKKSGGITQSEYLSFYSRAFERVLYWNRRGVRIREGQAAIVFNKLLYPIDAGYVDLQSVNGGSGAVLVYNYDGFVYPSDEARMLAETGDTSLRLARIGASLKDIVSSQSMQMLRRAGSSEHNTTCSECAYGLFCGPDPVMAIAQFGSQDVPVERTNHCQRTLWLFDFLLSQFAASDSATRSLFHQWARPVP